MSRIAAGICLCVSFLMIISTARAADEWISFQGKDGPGKGKRVVLMAGDEEYRSEEGLPQLAKILSTHHGFDCRVVFSIEPTTGQIDPNLHSNTPGLEALDNADLLIILTRFRDLPDDQMKHVVDYVMKGKPVIGLRTATHAFEIKKGTYAKWTWTSKVPGWQGGFGKQVLGETWVNHWGSHKKQSTRAMVVPGMESTPLLRGVSDIWVTTDVYEAKLPVQESVKPLLLGAVLSGMKPTDQPIAGKKNDPMMPIAWTKTYKLEGGEEGKSFCTTMGASSDLQNEGLRRLIVNATYWAVGLDVPAKADVDIVGEFKPSDYGARKNHPPFRPEDFAKDTWPTAGK
ncbi:MAG TPA: ThuA domain-containing protein [Tepidisphaeraceae bacterium]|jgi:hypothetical protein